MNPVPAFTIASNNYLGLAKVFAESYKRHHPSAEVYVCVVDRPAPEILYREMPFRTIFAEALPIPAFFNLAFRYGILELNTAVKPYVFQHLRDEYGLKQAFYFDPDIFILSPLSELAAALSRSSAVLTPHITAPLDDSFRPSERIILMSGVYNLGFLGLRLDQSTESFLHWWQERLYRFCVHDIHNGLFVDQSWMDLAPALLPSVHIERSPVYNIAYWNLPHRRLEQHNNIWEIDGVPAGFFHFSGLIAENLENISKYQNRVSLSSRPELRPLFERYRDLLMEADHQRLRNIPYRFQQFTDSGVSISPVLRHLLQRVDPYGVRWADPFDDHCEDSFLSWLREPLEFETAILNRAALSLWEDRIDLIHHFPDLAGEDGQRYADWLHGTPESERSGLSAALLDGVKKLAHRNWRERIIVPPHDGTPPREANALESINLTAPGTLATWLNDGVPAQRERPAITRLAMKLYALREDVQETFPDPLGKDQLQFGYWFVRSAAAEYKLHRSLVTPVLRGLPLRETAQFGLRRLRRSRSAGAFPVGRYSAHGHHPTVRRLSGTAPATAVAPPLAFEGTFSRVLRGVNLAGYFSSENGVGQMVRASKEVLRGAGIATAEIPLDQDLWPRIALGRVRQPSGAPYDVTLMHVNADETPRALSAIPAATLAGSIKIGYWFWELSYFPLVFADRFQMLDEIWAPTMFCKKAFEPLSSIPVRYVPPFVLPPRPRQIERRRFGLVEGRFYFFFAFDTWSIPERKNPMAVIDAFMRMVSRTRRDIGLVVKVNQASHDPDLVKRLRKRAASNKIVIHTDPLAREGIEQLMAATDAYVSLHRSEGLGLPPIEAMYLGKPVVATNYGGVTDFLDATTGYPVDHEITQLQRDYPPYPKGAVWATPRIEHAAEMMLRVVENPEEAESRAKAARERVEALYGLEAATRRFSNELARITGGSSLPLNLPVATSPAPVQIDRAEPVPSLPSSPNER